MTQEIINTSDASNLKGWAAGVIEQGSGAVHRFAFGGHAVTKDALLGVANALRKGNIQLRYLPGGTAFEGGYIDGGFMLLEHWGKGKNAIWYQSVVIHEAVHAAFDMQGAAKPFDLHSHLDEASGYIAQSMYLMYHGVELPSELVVLDPYTECVRAAWHAALALLNGRHISRDEAHVLEKAVAKYYKGELRHKAGLTGTPHK